MLGLNPNYRKQRLIHADDSLCSNLGVDTRRHHGVGLQARKEVQGGNLRHHSNREGLLHPPQCTRIRVDSRSTRGDFDVHDGILAEALFAVVAYTGCLPSKWKVTHRLKSIRAELSVMGCIISIGEVLYFAPQFISLFNGELSVGREIATIATIILVVLMIPLMLTSFYCVRANMNPKSWKKLQSTACLFYFSLWLHIFGLYASLNGGLADLFTGKHGEALICYTVLWGVYFIVRFIKLAIDRHNKVPANDQIIQDDDDLVPAREE